MGQNNVIYMAKKINPKNLPTISIVTASYDGALITLEKCLKIVRSQNYPQKNIEIVLGHGGSEKVIKPIAKKYKARYVLIAEAKQNAEYNRGVALNLARNELILILDHDNYMPTKNFLREYVKPLIEDKKVVAVESCYYHYDNKMPLLDRYFALLGALDPMAYYFGKADRMKWIDEKWTLLGTSSDKGEYYAVEFERDPRKIPSIGTNGCLMRRDIIFNNADIRPGHHYPIDVMVDVIKKGHNRFAFTKNSLIHETGSRGFFSYLNRRLKFMKTYHFEDLKKRRYSVYMPGDLPKLIKFSIYAVTFIKPLWDSITWFNKAPDRAWFLHPFMCFGIFCVYSYGTVVSIVKEYLK